MKLISVIIPVFNLENYIVTCLDSIYSQGVNEDLFEVIAVNDGSSDNSLERLKDYAAKHSNLKVLSQNNGGVSVARNNAIKKSESLYVSFLDADDMMAEGALNVLCEIINDKDGMFDVCYCRSFIKYDNNKLVETHLWQEYFQEGFIYNGNDITSVNYMNGGSVCGGIYKLSYLKEKVLFFGEGIANGEDTIFNYMLFAKNPRIMFLNQTFNFVTDRPESASHSYSMSRVEKFRPAMLYLIDYYNTKEMSDADKQALDASVYHIISLAVNMYIQVGGKNYSRIKNLLAIRNVWHLNVPWLPKNQRMKISILNMSFFLYYLLLRIKNRK